jgi:hypothetical protein
VQFLRGKQHFTANAKALAFYILIAISVAAKGEEK